MKNIPLVFVLFTNFALTACKKDPGMPPFKFYEGIGTLSVGQSGLFYLKDTKDNVNLTNLIYRKVRNIIDQIFRSNFLI